MQKFSESNVNVREMSQADGAKRFEEIGNAEIFTVYERGAILNHALPVWFGDDKLAFKKWVEESIRIPIEKAREFQRIQKAMSNSGLTEDSFLGITFSTLKVIVPILNRPDLYKEHYTEVLEMAKKATVEEVKRHSYGLRGVEYKTGKAKAPSDATLTAKSRETKEASNFREFADLLTKVCERAEGHGLKPLVLLVDPATRDNTLISKDDDLTSVFTKECWPVLMPFFLTEPLPGQNTLDFDAPKQEEQAAEVVATIDLSAESEEAAEAA